MPCIFCVTSSIPAFDSSNECPTICRAYHSNGATKMRLWYTTINSTLKPPNALNLPRAAATLGKRRPKCPYYSYSSAQLCMYGTVTPLYYISHKMGGATHEKVSADGAERATCACLSASRTGVKFPPDPHALHPLLIRRRSAPRVSSPRLLYRKLGVDGTIYFTRSYSLHNEVLPHSKLM